MKFFTFLLLLIVSISLVCANPSTFDSIKSKFTEADTDAHRLALLAEASPVTADAAAQIVSALLATHKDLIDATTEVYTFKGTLTSDQSGAIISILVSLQACFNGSIPKLVNNKAAITATGHAGDVAERLAALDGSAGALVAGLQTIVPASDKQKVIDVGGKIGTEAFNGCTAFDGKAC
ncbi:uncharacterized protein FA14DRAFT_8207 [Meira miltonrushii]|uniref:Uncharacterized protein n=1 Tax=Meira miltonrushii TaxID=1280837 RepID=A0A316VLI2_9BASI|nr:uncharacterized protein FA14DRAFT_8207 [Meira miltonrushii]PWN36941.1 hypothetical protein FA14DRAFT_8207 [Meira miltonrushii]